VATNKPLPTVDTPPEKFDLAQSLKQVPEYLKSVRAELDKVQWPNRQQVISESAAVFLMVMISALFIYLVDSLFHTLARLVF